MIVKDAKANARQWVSETGANLPGFQGAFFHGSTAWLPDDAPLPPASDVDVMVVLDDPGALPKLGKFRYQGILLEVSFLARDEVASPEVVLGAYHLAGSFWKPSIIADPTGQLGVIHHAVARDYTNRTWVRRRCAHARDKVLRGFPFHESALFPDQVNAWLFPAGVLTHVLLVAGLRNPTVRTRYVAVRALLADYGYEALYERLLDPLGCAHLSKERVKQHLATLTEAFETAAVVAATPFFFSADITRPARPVAIDGSRDLIDRGDHREAVFWMAATYTRCQTILAHDAPPAVQRRVEPGYRALLADLGIVSVADLVLRKAAVDAFLPEVWSVAEAIMAANPDITN